MLKIVALNQAELDEESNDEVVTVSNEAQEAIAESEYIRAIKLKHNGKLDAALSLLNELLETKVLNELCESSKEQKLWCIRYNCHKNIAMIYEEKEEYEQALLNYMRAMQIDKTDVYMLHRFGQLALQCNALDFAECAFENCIIRNPKHWGAVEGLLRTLCHKRNVLGAYGWALKLYRRDNSYKYAAKVLLHISRQFKDVLDVYSKFWNIADEDELNVIAEYITDTDDVFPSTKGQELTPPIVVKPQNIEQFRVAMPTWLALAQYITNVYNYLAESQQSMLYTMDFIELLADECTLLSNGKVSEENQQEVVENASAIGSQIMEATAAVPVATEQAEPEEEQDVAIAAFASPVANDACKTTSDLLGNDDSDSNAKSDSNDGGNNKPKSKRRCSDLHMLEQWGWHKSRRYSSRKKGQDRVGIDTTLNSALRRMFAKFTNNTFDKTWPFNDETANNNALNSETEQFVCTHCAETKEVSLEEFASRTEQEFSAFLERLKLQKFDLMFIIFEWLRHISAVYQLKLPNEIKDKYLEIFMLYLKHFDWSNWHHMTDENFEASYRICLFYLELELEQTHNNNSEMTLIWREVLDHMLLQSGPILIRSDDHHIYHLRLVHLKYSMHRHEQELALCIACLEQMSQLMSELTDNYVLHMPNSHADCINKISVKQSRTQLERQLSLTKVSSLFDAENWTELIQVVVNNIRNLNDNHECENWSKDFRAQIELLLSAFWCNKAYENCLLWSEMFLHYTTEQYLKEARTSSYRQKLWAQSINFILSYVESVLLNEGYESLAVLTEYLSRMVQNIIRLLAYQLDAPFEKNNNPMHELDIRRPWIILHQVMLREECQNPVAVKSKSISNSDSEQQEEEELIPNSFLLLFTAHQYLGKRHWCTRDNGELLCYILDLITPNLRAPLYDACRDAVYEHLEQITYCLFGYPQKKTRMRHLEEHEAQQVELDWNRAVQLFTLYKPECLPEFNSYKLESITAFQEQLLIKIIALMPNDICPQSISNDITDFLAGNISICDVEVDRNIDLKLPYKINSIFYLLADYYFKNRDFNKAIKFYTLDLSCNTTRFDSWAGMALSKASLIETKLNGLTPLNFVDLLDECDDVIRCFKRCITLNRNLTLLWIEYGSFAYTIHSYCSRHLKHESEKLSIEQFSYAEERKEKMVSIAFDCFSLAAQLQDAQLTMQVTVQDNAEANEEKWLCQYMLGKIAEKRKEDPQVYLNCYLKAATYLYESNATYPIKINHSNPTALSVEALEVFYRTNSAIIKYLEHAKEISRVHGDLFKNVLNNLCNSPFAYNKAKIDGNSLNALKRKINEKQTAPMNGKISKTEQNTTNSLLKADEENINLEKAIIDKTNEAATLQQEQHDSVQAQSVAPTTTSTIPTAISLASSNNSSATNSSSTSTSSDTDTEDDTSEEMPKKNDEVDSNNTGICAESDLTIIYKQVVQNLEECVTRFSEHYKSIYRLVYHYLNSTTQFCDYKRCEELLLGQYRTTVGNQINGLFYDRKNNNLFNGIWRIPSSEIDRPGSFSTQLVKCVSLLIQVLMKNNNYKLLIDIGLQLYKTPDNDKRYIKDTERLELYQQCTEFCTRILQNILRKYAEKRNDVEILSLLIDIYRIYKKCQKYMNQKEPLFTQLMVDVYKLYVQDKVENLPEHLNYFDLAIKLCIQELGLRKNIEKAGADAAQMEIQAALTRKNNIPGLLMRRGRTSSVNKQANSGFASMFPPHMLDAAAQGFLPKPNMQRPNTSNTNFSMLPFQTDSLEFQRLCEEYYLQICKSGQINPVPVLSYPQALLAMAESAQRSVVSTQPEVSFLPIPNSANATDKKSLAATTTITTTTSATETTVNTANSNINLLQKLPPTLDVTALMKPATTMSNATTVLDTAVTVTPLQNSSKEIALTELTAHAELLAQQQNKVKRNNTKARQTAFQRNTATIEPIKSCNNNLRNEQLSYLDMLASTMSNSELSFIPTKARAATVTATTALNVAKELATSAAAFNNFNNPVLYNTSIMPVASSACVPAATSVSTPAISPTKTLQQKLAERQKANALNDMQPMRMPQNQIMPNTASTKPAVDVIYID